MTLSIEKYLAHQVRTIEVGLDNVLPHPSAFDGGVAEAMRYAVLAGGKRIRPVLVIAGCEACGGDPDLVFPAALSVEFIHGYSLIHDDLPSMDDDDMRRGRSSCHKKFGVAMAILAGDALQALAFQTLGASDLGTETKAALVVRLAAASGADGMVGGQALDLEWIGKVLNQDELETLHGKKTGALLSSAPAMGAEAAGASPSVIDGFCLYGKRLGLAFQVVDDLLDVAGNPNEIGKAPGSDKKNRHYTYVDLMGAAKAGQLAKDLVAAARSSLPQSVNLDSPLHGLADFVARRIPK